MGIYDQYIGASRYLSLYDLTDTTIYKLNTDAGDLYWKGVKLLQAIYIDYDNTSSLLTATNVQDAIDEVYNYTPQPGTITGQTLVWNNSSTRWEYNNTVSIISNTATITNILKTGNYRETYITLVSAPVVNIDWSLANSFYIVMDQNVSFTFSNIPTLTSAQEIVVYLAQDGTGNRVPTFSVSWGDNGTPIWSTTINLIDIVVFKKLGNLSNVQGIFIGGGFS